MKNSEPSASSRSKATGAVSLEVPNDAHYIDKVSQELLQYLKTFTADESLLFDIKLCTEEALRNAMVHGNRSRKGTSVKVRYGIEGRRFEIMIEDEGEGFDYRKVPDPTKDENLLKVGGRGVFLIRHLMDEVAYSGRGNKVTMVKYINGGSHERNDGE